MRAHERRRRRFWRSKSTVETDLAPIWKRKLAAVRVALPAYDQLPAPIRAAMQAAHHDFSAEALLQLFQDMSQAMSEPECVRQIVLAIQMNDQQLDQQDRARDKAMASKATGLSHPHRR